MVANNAGYGLFGAVEEASGAQARAIFDTNVFGVLNVLRVTLPLLRAQGSGHVLQGSSLYGRLAHPGVGLLAGMGQPAATAFLGNLRFTEVMTDYDQTVRAVQTAIGELPPEAFSSAARAARAIIAAVDADEPPLRLAVGRQAEQDMRAALAVRLKDLDDWSAVSQEVDA